jgi:hypothetical protein
MIPKTAIACCAIGILVGVCATRLLTAEHAPRSTDRPQSSARADRGERAMPLVIENRSGARADEIRTLVAEEVRTALREHSAGQSIARDVPAQAPGGNAPEPTPAFQPTKDRIAERVTQGSWTTADRDWMRGALGTVSDSERAKLMSQVIVAANTGALRVDVEGPLF